VNLKQKGDEADLADLTALYVSLHVRMCQQKTTREVVETKQPHSRRYGA
jgi:hypothetical protein